MPRVEFEGTIHEFPDDFTPEEISAALASTSPAPPARPAGPPAPPLAGAAPGGGDLSYTDPGYAEAIAPRAPGQRGPSTKPILPGILPSPRGFQIGAQGVGAGLAGTAGLPADLSTGLANLIVGGANLAPGVDLPSFGPSPLGKESIMQAGGTVARAMGVDPVPEAEMTPGERLAYNVSDIGTQAVVAGGGLAKAAAERTADAAGRMVAPRLADAFLRPYLQTPGKALATDLAAGAGSGAALTAAQETVPRDQWYTPGVDAAAMMAGGVGGATAASAGRVPAQAVRGIRATRPDPNIKVDPATLIPVARGVADRAARVAQKTTAEDPRNVARDIGARVEEARAHGEPDPTSGLASGDPGLITAEGVARGRDPVPFVVRDQQTREAAVEKVAGLRDPDAEPRAAQRFVEADATARQRAAAEVTRETRGELDVARAESAKKMTDAEAAREARLARKDQEIATRGQAAEGAVEGEKAVGGAVQGRQGGEGAASERLDKAVVDDTMRPAIAKQRADYQGIDPEGAVVRDVGPMVDVVKDIRANVPKTVPPGEVLPEAWLRQIEGLGAKKVETGLVDEAGKPITREEGGTVTFKALNEMRPFLSDAIRGAEKRGEYSYARSLRALKSHIDDEAGRLADEGSEAVGPPALGSPNRQRQGIRELDARNAPDEEYRALTSTGSKEPLRRGETWRSRVERVARSQEGWTPRLDAEGRRVRDQFGYTELDPPKTLAEGGAASAAAEAGRRAQEAVRSTREDFAPKFSQGEGGRLRRDIQRDDLSRSGTPPTATAGRFLKTGPGGKEVAADLDRILKGSKSEAEGRAAARDYVLADMAKVVGSNDKINPNRLRAWIANREGMFSSMPGLKDEATATLRDVVNKRAASTALQRDLEKAVAERRASVVTSRREIETIKADNKLTESQKQRKVAEAERAQAEVERDIQREATSLLIDADPVKAAKAVFSHRDPETAMKEIVAKLARDPEAAAGWKRAVVEEMVDRVTNANLGLTSGPDGPVSAAKLVKFIDGHERTLAAVFSAPGEMNALRRAQRILEPLAKRQLQATVGSATAERDRSWGMMEAAVLAATGNAITTGMIMKRIRVAIGLLPNSDDEVKALVNRMFLDPELAQHLLTRNVRDVRSAPWNAKLNRLLAYGEAAREAAEDRE